MARWPGQLPVGVVDERLTLTFDLTASILSAAGAKPRADRPDLFGKQRSARTDDPPFVHNAATNLKGRYLTKQTIFAAPGRLQPFERMLQTRKVWLRLLE